MTLKFSRLLSRTLKSDATSLERPNVLPFLIWHTVSPVTNMRFLSNFSGKHKQTLLVKEYKERLRISIGLIISFTISYCPLFAVLLSGAHFTRATIVYQLLHLWSLCNPIAHAFVLLMMDKALWPNRYCYSGHNGQVGRIVKARGVCLQRDLFLRVALRAFFKIIHFLVR